jgi:hypothetical protein
LEGAGKDLDYGRLAGAADAQVPNTDDLAAEGVVAKDAMLPKAQADLNAQLIKFGQSQQDHAGNARGQITTTFEYDVEHVLLDDFSPLPHVGL